MHIRAIIVGCGAVIDCLYKRPLRELERKGFLSVLGLVDKTISHAKQLQKFFPKSSVFDNLNKAIRECGSNLAIVASPPIFHAEHTILALQKGNHVLCEKPMALTKAQCLQMVEAAHDSGLYLAIGMTRRFNPSLAYVKQLISREKLGDIVSFSFREGNRYDWPIKTPAGFHREKGGGGVLFDVGPHLIDTIVWLLGRPSIISYKDDAIGNGVEANCIIHVEVAASVGFIHLSWDHDLVNELRITGTEAEVIVALNAIDKLSVKFSGKNGNYRTVIPQIAFPLNIDRQTQMGIPKNIPDCIYFQIIQLIRAIQLGECIPSTGEEGAAVISIIEECYKIAEPIDMSWLPPYQNETYKRLYWRK